VFLGRAVDRRFLALFAFFALVDFDFFARGMITSVLSIHSVETALQSQERIYAACGLSMENIAVRSMRVRHRLLP
jgi:hypothetical protein